MKLTTHKTWLVSAMAAAILAACGGGGGSSSTATTAPAAPTLNAAAYDIRQIIFTWADVSGATYYRLFENPDGASGYTQIGGDIPHSAVTASSYEHDISVHFQDWPNASYVLQACNSAGCSGDSAPIFAMEDEQAIGYIKASNSDAGDAFGFDVAVSGDGTTMVVGARDEDSSATGIDGNQADDSAAQAGAAYVFVNDGAGWTQQVYLKGNNTEAGDEFGRRVAISQDGNTVAVAAYKEDGAGNATDASGAVYVFVRNAGVWSQQAYLQASNAEADDNFGYDIALSADGNTLLVGAIGEDSGITGPGAGAPSNAVTGDGIPNSGAAYVFVRTAGAWNQTYYLKATNTDIDDTFGYSVALSDDGVTAAVGAIWEDSATGADINDDTAGNAGAVYLYKFDGVNWMNEEYIKASTPGAGDFFGQSVSLSDDGTTLAVGADGEDSNAITINDNEADNSALSAGAAYVFTYNGGVWTQQAYVKATNAQAGDHFGFALSLSNDGDTLAVGAGVNNGPGGEQSAATGIDGAQANNSADDSGAVYIFTRSGAAWSPSAYVKAPNTDANDSFGAALSLSDDGRMMAVAAHGESSSATGVSGNQSDDSAGVSGAVYLY